MYVKRIVLKHDFLDPLKQKVESNTYVLGSLKRITDMWTRYNGSKAGPVFLLYPSVGSIDPRGSQPLLQGMTNAL